MNGYIFFYNGRQVELYAHSLSDAKLQALKHFKPPKSKEHMVHGMLAERDDETVTHTADF